MTNLSALLNIFVLKTTAAPAYGRIARSQI